MTTTVHGGVWVDTLAPHHYEALFDIARRAEPYLSGILYEQFEAVISERKGFVVVGGDGQLIGSINFSDFMPLQNAVIHCFIDPDYQRRWASRKIAKTVYKYVFETLKLPRISGFCIPGKSDAAGRILQAMGFKPEGFIRKGARLADGYHDVILFGMLREECRWL